MIGKAKICQRKNAFMKEDAFSILKKQIKLILNKITTLSSLSFFKLLIFKNYNLYVRCISRIKGNKNINIIKYILALEWIGLSHKAMIHFIKTCLL